MARPSSQSRSYHHVVLPGRPAREQEVGHVGARDEQDQRDGAEENEQGGAHGTEHDACQRLQGHAARVVLGVGALQVGGDGGQLLLRERNGCRLAQPPQDEDGMRLARRRPRVRSERGPDVHTHGASPVRESTRVIGGLEDLERAEVRRGGQHSDDLVGEIVDAQAAPHHGGIPGEQLGP